MRFIDENLLHLAHTKKLTEPIETSITALQQEAEDANVEGLVLKSSDSLYETTGKKTNFWLKLKKQ